MIIFCKMSFDFGLDLDELSSVFTNTDDTPVGKSNLKTQHDLSQAKIKKIIQINSQLSGSKKRKSSISSDSVKEKIKRKDSVASEDNEFCPSKISIVKVNSLEGCIHEVAVPTSVKYSGLITPQRQPAKQYPFSLDPFQKAAILCIENNHTVLVSAHTSAGKTVCAEYAIAVSLREKQRVIYTTPIKALSNQKFREFSEEFKDVGLMTGDVTINPTANILIMTTEILRLMLYRGSEIMREVGWVIFDEIHYMRDKYRGVVWEETLILLPHQIHCVFLSATIPNATQFAQWVAMLHNHPCHVVYTDYRPVPLQHYAFPCGGEGIYLLVDEKGEFREDNFNAAMQVLTSCGDNALSDMALRGRKGGFIKGEETSCFKLIKLIMNRDLHPVIVFSFSKRQCESYALQLTKLDCNSKDEKKSVELIFNKAISTLSEEDQKLPQIQSMLPLLKKGIGIHHGGLLPLLKETVEILFSEGLIKCLFATETFAMGLNMPARTVLFTSIDKFDGKGHRMITSGEYIQMSGRAGRRGKDDRGTVIMMLDSSVTPASVKEIVKGKSDPLNSAFYLTYNMVVNLLRIEEINPEYLMRRSFFQFQNSATLPQLKKEISRLIEENSQIHIEDEESLQSYRAIEMCLDDLEKEKWACACKPKYLLPFLKCGRLIRARKDEKNFDWVVCISVRSVKQKTPKMTESHEIQCLACVTHDSVMLGHPDAYVPGDSRTSVVPVEWELLDIPISGISQLSAVCLNAVGSTNLKTRAGRTGIGEAVNKVKRKLNDVIPLLDPQADMNCRDDKLPKIMEKIAVFQDRKAKHKLCNNPNLNELLEKLKLKQTKEEELESLKAEMTKRESLLQLDELKSRKRILRRLDFCGDDEVISLKGRVACEISSSDELLLSELLLDGAFNDLSASQCAAILSTFVFDDKVDKNQEKPTLDHDMERMFKKVIDRARYIAKVSVESRLNLDEVQYIESFSTDMIPVVLAWTNGSSFAQLCRMTWIFEGSIIRCMRRLEELLRQMHSAAKVIGNVELEAKFSEAMVLLHRDIIFAGSLYL